MSTVQTYAFRGRDNAGKVVKGRVDASGESQVVARLRTMGVSPIQIKEAPAATGLHREISIPGFSQRVGLKELAVTSRQMATMLAAGLSLLRTLTILSEQTDNKPLALILAQVRDDVERGSSLSAAMYKHPVEFPPIMVNMVRAGETGGFLDGALETIAQNFEKEVKLRSTIKSAMTYPVVVLVMALLGVLAMLVFIVPVFENMFAGLGGQLPLPTMMLVYLSRAMVWLGPILLIVVVGVLVWWRQNRNSDAVRRRLDPVKLRLPVFGTMLKKIAIARFSRNLANMLRAGVPILQALTVVGDTSGNWVVEKALQDVTESVRRGRSIAQPLGASGVFPPMVVQMVAVGEDSGELEIMLEKVAQFYDTEVEATTSGLTALVEPLLIGFLGVVIGGMIIALYLPVFNIFNLIH